jgi:hypothetical protein
MILSFRIILPNFFTEVSRKAPPNLFYIFFFKPFNSFSHKVEPSLAERYSDALTTKLEVSFSRYQIVLPTWSCVSSNSSP